MNQFHIKVSMEYAENYQTQRKDILIDQEHLWSVARNGSKAAREFLHRIIEDQLVSEFLDLILKDMVKREEEEAETRKIFGGPITVDSMETAIINLARKRRDE